jgi:hypothetical protein
MIGIRLPTASGRRASTGGLARAHSTPSPPGVVRQRWRPREAQGRGAEHTQDLFPTDDAILKERHVSVPATLL